MNKEKLWLTIMSVNTEFADTSKRLTLESVRGLFDSTWNAAYEAGASDMHLRQREIASAQAGLQLPPEFIAALLSELKPKSNHGKKNPPKGKP
jgi:hypothetical protein